MVTKKMTTIYFIKNQNLNNFIYKLFNNMNDDTDYVFVDIHNDYFTTKLETSFILVTCNESDFDKFWKLYKNSNILVNSTFLQKISNKK
jgi:hypothetical protein